MPLTPSIGKAELMKWHTAAVILQLTNIHHISTYIHTQRNCCSTGSKKPHRCCYLLQNFNSHQIGQQIPQNYPFLGNIQASHLKHVPWLHWVQTANSILIGSGILKQFMVAINRQTDRQCYICSSMHMTPPIINISIVPWQLRIQRH